MNILMGSSWRKYFTQDSGGVAVEFSLVFIPFVISILFIAEMCRVVFISSALDLILAESGEIASVSSSADNYESYFTREINDRLKHWPLISRPVNVDISIIYCENLLELIGNSCTAGNALGKPLALYKIRVNYEPLFFIFPQSLTTRELSRRIVFIQEYQRETSGGE